jgi:hypothetical protein
MNALFPVKERTGQGVETGEKKKEHHKGPHKERAGDHEGHEGAQRFF